MVTFTYTFAPISQVLRHGGQMKFGDLAAKLMQLDPERFRDEKTVETAITIYTACLDFRDGFVRFDRNAKKYARQMTMERDIQAALHGEIENMDQWALYPFKTRKNSDVCYINVPWNEIPKNMDEHEENGINYPPGCDFREQGENSCRAGCRVRQEVLKKYGLIKS